ncbi:MAG: hypothetical protein HKP30_07040 [Myxococcales bacterium]|nr:hypothetical protein [Myxococcales bacterium]
MSGSDDRPKLSFSERDRLRRERERGYEPAPRGAAAKARSKDATATYLKEVDKLFSDAQGGAAGDALAKAVEQAHGTPELTAACAAYRDGVGMPADASLLSLFLDAEDPALVAEALRALAAGHAEGRLEISRGVKSQLRVLEQHSDDDVAYEAEELLARL